MAIRTLNVLNSEKIPIIKVKYCFGVLNIQYLLLCLIDNYTRFKQSLPFVTPTANRSGVFRAHA